MAVGLLKQEMSNLCIGKPALTRLCVTATVEDALVALRRCGETFLSVWNAETPPRCVAKISLTDVVCFLSEPHNLKNPGLALQVPLSALISNLPCLVRHLEPKASLSEALDLILEGAQNLVIPLENRKTWKRKLLHKCLYGTLHNSREYCWLTQEDIIRFIVSSISLFNSYHFPTQTIDALNVVERVNVLALRYHSPASYVVTSVAKSILTQTSVAVIDMDRKLIGEISPIMINHCHATVAAAIATLSAGELMSYMGWGGPSGTLLHIVKERLKERELGAALELIDGVESGNSCSSTDSSSSSDEDCKGKSHMESPSRGMQRWEVIVCHPWSSLTATMIQALSHRVSYIWVVEEDGTLAGVVTLAGILKLFRERIRA